MKSSTRTSRWAATAVALMMIVSSVACSSAPATPQTRSFTDSAGRTVTLPGKIDKVAASGSLAQIFIFPIAADKLVGLASAWSDAAAPYIAEQYRGLPVIGQFYGQGNLNLEEITALGPAVIIDVGERKDTIAADMDEIQERTGIPTVFIEANFDSLDATYTKLGELLGEEKAASDLAKYAKDLYAKISSGIPAEKARILYVTGNAGTNVIARGSFHSQMLEVLADNVAVVESPVSSGSGNEISLEQIPLWDPDVIIFAPGGYFKSAADDTVYKNTRAFRDGRVYEAPGVPYNWLGFPPSVNRLLGAVWLAETLYPESFDFDMKAETKKFYELFYHTQITDEQYAELTKNAVK